jgi:hypothetical protein
MKCLGRFAGGGQALIFSHTNNLSENYFGAANICSRVWVPTRVGGYMRGVRRTSWAVVPRGCHPPLGLRPPLTLSACQVKPFLMTPKMNPGNHS